MVRCFKTPESYVAGRRTLNHVMARAARQGRIFTKDPGAADGFRHDGDGANEWELVTLERLRESVSENHMLTAMPRFWHPRPDQQCACEHHARA